MGQIDNIKNKDYADDCFQLKLTEVKYEAILNMPKKWLRETNAVFSM